MTVVETWLPRASGLTPLPAACRPPEDPEDGLGSPMNHLLLEVPRSYHPGRGLGGSPVLQSRVSCLPPFSHCWFYNPREDGGAQLGATPPASSIHFQEQGMGIPLHTGSHKAGLGLHGTVPSPGLG